MKKKEKQVDIIMAIIMSIVMGVIFAFVARRNAAPQAIKAMPPFPVALITSVIESVIVGIIVVLVIPMGRMGRALSSKFNAFPPSVKFRLLNGIPFAVINAIIVSAVCSFISIAQAHSHMPPEQAPPLMVMWVLNWLRTLPLSIIVSYVLAVIIAPFVVKAVGLGGPPPGAGGPPSGEGRNESL